jgi:predicted nucleotidyltransferase
VRKIRNNKEIVSYLKEFIKELEQYHSLKCVILFGSRARKDFLPYSDIDLIFIGNFKEKFVKRSKLIYEKYDFHLGLDAFCYIPEEFDKMFHEGVVSNLDAINDGICLLGHDFFMKYKKKLNYLKSKGLRKEPSCLDLTRFYDF